MLKHPTQHQLAMSGDATHFCLTRYTRRRRLDEYAVIETEIRGFNQRGTNSKAQVAMHHEPNE